jgi:hypothetical protein
VNLPDGTTVHAQADKPPDAETIRMLGELSTAVHRHLDEVHSTLGRWEDDGGAPWRGSDPKGEFLPLPSRSRVRRR